MLTIQDQAQMSRAHLDELLSQGQYLDEGAFGIVWRVPWGKGHAILKTMKAISAKAFRTELFIMERLNGAGGAPRLLAVCYEPRAIVMSSRGELTLSDAMEEDLPDWHRIYIVLKVGQCLRELHERGVIHNDIHARNVRVTLSPWKLPQVFLIDFGLSTLSQDALSTLSQETRSVLELKKNLTYSRDVKFLGRMLLNIFDIIEIRFDSIKEIIAMTWTGMCEPAPLDDILLKLNSVLANDFKINLSTMHDPESPVTTPDLSTKKDPVHTPDISAMHGPKDIAALEKVQCRATKIIQELSQTHVSGTVKGYRINNSANQARQSGSH
ncbi:uncharacterized protein [Procambarus clarkii]|uniref:uncharacterized protein n=1 Tax=Procambarus clarkii TaxID=6728 RepID=UPI003744AFC2